MPKARILAPDTPARAARGEVDTPTEGDVEPEAPRSEWVGGLGRVLIAVYLILAIAASARSVYQILAKFDEAPLAYTLSAVSGAVYIVATLALIMRHRRGWRAVAWTALGFELAGVLVVGTLSIAVPEYFRHPSVWSWYGDGYMWIPLVLPILGMIWLRREGRLEAEEAAADARAANDSGSLY